MRTMRAAHPWGLVISGLKFAICFWWESLPCCFSQRQRGYLFRNKSLTLTYGFLRPYGPCVILASVDASHLRCEVTGEWLTF